MKLEKLDIAGRKRVVCRHDVVFIPPGVRRSLAHNGLTDLTFIVVTTPVEDRQLAFGLGAT